MKRREDAERALNQYNQSVYDPLAKEVKRLFGYPEQTIENQRAIKSWERYREWRATGDESDRLGEAFVDADFDMLVVEAPDLPALLWKVEKALDEDGDLPDHYRLAILKDARRLLK